MIGPQAATTKGGSTTARSLAQRSHGLYGVSSEAMQGMSLSHGCRLERSHGRRTYSDPQPPAAETRKEAAGSTPGPAWQRAAPSGGRRL